MRRRHLLPLLLGSCAAAAAALRGRASATGQVTRFLALADTGSADAHQRAVGLQMAAVHRRRPVNLVLLGGDIVYPCGEIALLDAAFSRPYAELLAAGVPFHAVLGNHDIATDNGNALVAEPLLGMGGRHYNLRRGPVEIFLLDTNANADWQRQLSWLRTVLPHSTASWKVVVGHHPIHSSGLYGNDRELQAKLMPLLQSHGVQLYINGHDHHYERSKPIGGITYLVVGGGGAPLRPVIATEQTARAQSVHSFAEIEATDQELRLSAWDATGGLIDQMVLQKR